MYLRSDDRPTTSQFTFRVAVISGMALIGFALIFFRLWYLEILSGDKFERAAQNNRVREVKVQAPRGEILDARGNVLVDNRPARTLQVRADRLPKDGRARARELVRLADVAELKLKSVKRQIKIQTRSLPATPVTLARDIPDNLVYYLGEHKRQFRGVSVENVFVRHYPNDDDGAHLFGYVGEVTKSELADTRFKGLSAGDIVGKGGLETAYDDVLRGRPGITRIQVDAFGRPRGGQANDSRLPEAGNNLVTSIDLKVQRAGEAALAAKDLPGAFVAMDVEDGSILGLGSYPTYDPSILTPPVSRVDFNSVYSEDLEQPIFNRAIQTGYPAASTFKPITALAALESGQWSLAQTIYDDGSFELSDTQVLKNAADAVYGSLDIIRALRVSSDFFFYNLGFEIDDSADPDGGPLQKYASELGIGSETGIDIPGENAGLLPTPKWRNDLYDQAAEPDSASGTERDFLGAGETDRPWSVGDNVNLAIGQGDLQTTPLQMARAYAAFANGGRLVRPHLAGRVEDPSGRVVSEIKPEPGGTVDIDPSYRTAILEGLRQAAMEPEGTSYGVFGGYPIEIAGKTGTAETADVQDQSWYVALAPYDDPQIVVAVTVERGGFGATTAAPMARDILNAYFGYKGSDIDRVTAPSAGND